MKTSEAPVITTQQTSKALKLHIIYAAILWWIGLIITVLSGQAGEDRRMTVVKVGLSLFAIGSAWLVITKTRIWWHHK